MTSFGATQMRHGNFQATFKIKGQLYHTVGPLLQGIQEEPNIFTRTYLIGYGELVDYGRSSSLQGIQLRGGFSWYVTVQC